MPHASCVMFLSAPLICFLVLASSGLGVSPRPNNNPSRDSAETSSQPSSNPPRDSGSARRSSTGSGNDPQQHPFPNLQRLSLSALRAPPASPASSFVSHDSVPNFEERFERAATNFHQRERERRRQEADVPPGERVRAPPTTPLSPWRDMLFWRAYSRMGVNRRRDTIWSRPNTGHRDMLQREEQRQLEQSPRSSSQHSPPHSEREENRTAGPGGPRTDGKS